MSYPPCSNFNCNSNSHQPWQYPLPPICSGCHSNKHLWAQCPEICMNCGTPNHKIDYCYDFEPGTCHKRWNFPREVPLAWPYPISYKTNYEAIKNGKSRFGPQSEGGGWLLIPSPLTSKAPGETSQTSWTRARPSWTAVNILPSGMSQPVQSNVYAFPVTGGSSTSRNLGQPIAHLMIPTASQPIKNVCQASANGGPLTQEKSEYFNPPKGPEAWIAGQEGSVSTAYTIDLPLLPVSNPLKAQRPLNEHLKQNDVASQQRRLLVENVPPATTQKTIELLFHECSV